MPFFFKALQLCFFLSLPLISTGQTLNSIFNPKPKSMSQRWELDTITQAGTFVITPYKPVYVLPVRWSSSPNGQPVSGNPDPEYDVTDNANLNNIEAKFQLSFKVKILQGILWGEGDLWAAYTQKAHWQVYNATLSRPFREINYEPEVILNFDTNYNLFGFKGRMAGIAFNHQSNGRNYPLSRSWNRIIGHIGFERTNWDIMVRGWYRLPDDIDDNPNISSYVGYGDITVVHAMGKNIFSGTVAPNFCFNENMKGSIELTWSRTLSGNLKGYLQFFHGYGETLIDYNNLQTTIGVGVSLIEWM